MADKKAKRSYIVRSIYVPQEKEELWDRLEKKAQKQGKSVAALVLDAVEQFLDGNKN